MRAPAQDEGQGSTPRRLSAEAVKELSAKPTAEALAELRRAGIPTVWTAPRRERRALARKHSPRPPLYRPIGRRLHAQLVAALAPLGAQPTDIGVGLSGRKISFVNIPTELHDEARRILTQILSRRFLSPERRRALAATAAARAALAARREGCPRTAPRRTCRQPRSPRCSRSRAAAGGGGGGAGDDGDGDGDDPDDVGLVPARGWRS